MVVVIVVVVVVGGVVGVVVIIAAVVVVVIVVVVAAATVSLSRQPISRAQRQLKGGDTKKRKNVHLLCQIKPGNGNLLGTHLVYFSLSRRKCLCFSH